MTQSFGKTYFFSVALHATVLVMTVVLTSAHVYAEGSRQSASVIIPAGHESIYKSWGYAPAIRSGDTIYVSGVIVTLAGQGSIEDRYALGFKNALEEIEKILVEAKASLDDVIDITTYHTDLPGQIRIATEVRKAAMAEPHPTWTAVGTTALAVPEGVTEIKVIARVGI